RHALPDAGLRPARRGATVRVALVHWPRGHLEPTGWCGRAPGHVARRWSAGPRGAGLGRRAGELAVWRHAQFSAGRLLVHSQRNTQHPVLPLFGAARRRHTEHRR
ncbi:MAG: hypothetical protein ACK56I_05230, partial [bacterium]